MNKSGKLNIIPAPSEYLDHLKAGHGTASQSNKELFYSTALDALITYRKYLSEFSFPRAHDRLLRTKRIRESESLQSEEDKSTAELYSSTRELGLSGSQFADDRPLTSVRFSPSDSLISSSSLTGTVKIWDAKSLSHVSSCVGHQERVTSLAWCPLPNLDTTSPDGNSLHKSLLATTSADGGCFIWNTSSTQVYDPSGKTSSFVNSVDVDESEGGGRTSARGENVTDMDIDEEQKAYIEARRALERQSRSLLSSVPRCELLQKLKGHEGVVTRCEFHPCRTLIGTCGQDYSWRLWDVETSQELLLQDGHAKECSAISFHQDGSLVLTGDHGGVALLWDIRSGQCVHVFQGHVKKIVCAHFNPNGFVVATGSADHMVRVWDLRKKKCGYALPAHFNVISDVRFSSSGELLTTSSFDGTIKIWNARNFDILRTLTGHQGKVMCSHISSDERCIISGGFDRTIKLWSRNSII